MREDYPARAGMTTIAIIAWYGNELFGYNSQINRLMANAQLFISGENEFEPEKPAFDSSFEYNYLWME